MGRTPLTKMRTKGFENEFQSVTINSLLPFVTTYFTSCETRGTKREKAEPTELQVN